MNVLRFERRLFQMQGRTFRLRHKGFGGQVSVRSRDNRQVAFKMVEGRTFRLRHKGFGGQVSVRPRSTFRRWAVRRNYVLIWRA